MELGIFTFADVDPADGIDRGREAERRMKNLLEEISLADELGLDVFGVGEHHRVDYLVSSPATVLAAAAATTKKIRLTSAVTILSSDDPVRVFQQFSSVDLISGGRAEIMAGRGSFIESFPLFGHALEDYDQLYAEKLDLLLKIRDNEHVTWSGETRPPLTGQGIYPRPVQNPLPVWIAAGGTPQSMARAGFLGLPLIIAILGGQPRRFAPLFDLYARAAEQAGHDQKSLKRGISVHGFVAETAERARDIFYAPQAAVMNRLGRERGWGPTSRAQFDASTGPEGALFVGEPEGLAKKIVAHARIFGLDRFMLQMAVGLVPHDELMRAIELFATKTAPMVRDMLADDKA
ncbi:LLM class flavin-dependent oxidoreductase [Martelella alba]|uniref:LLM class flavin-dependent oxidoreductase n=1 Tax=Martelella alba TaxID=2590451 RepID=A0A506UER7_9HYPH|nr:LLM class flavin-dependent oxidoreductase [Martelella alba]TPW31661.1 LLM class flavin-dependent oxidoreductase [Martelella alba]